MWIIIMPVLVVLYSIGNVLITSLNDSSILTETAMQTGANVYSWILVLLTIIGASAYPFVLILKGYGQLEVEKGAGGKTED